MNRFILIFGLISLVFFASISLAGIPKMINYQGMLTDNSGTPLTGPYNLTFKIWTDTTGGSSLWTETQNGVQVQNGLFNVILGKQTALNLSFDQQYWLEVAVGAETMPRIRFTSVGYAYRAEKADSAIVAMSASTGGGWIDDGTVVRLETSDDSVGIGTDAPGIKLHVVGGGFQVNSSQIGGSGCRISGNEIAGTGVNPPGFNPLHIKPGDNSSNLLLAENGGNVAIGMADPMGFKLLVNGAAAKPGGGSWIDFSDIRLKEVKSTYEYGLGEVSKLNPVHYSYKHDNALGLPSDQEFVGLVAQEVEKVIPDAVKKNDKGYLMVNNDPIIWAMLNAIKELKAENEGLKKRIEVLEAK